MLLVSLFDRLNLQKKKLESDSKDAVIMRNSNVATVIDKWLMNCKRVVTFSLNVCKSQYHYTS